MNLPRRALAEIARGKPVFRQVIETGGHPASLDRLLRGEGDVASIDCVTYAFWRHYRPETAARVRVIGETPSSPSIPFVTSIATPSSIVRILRDALHRVATDPRYTAARGGLMISGVEDVPDEAYRGLLDYEKQAAALGYPQLLCTGGRYGHVERTPQFPVTVSYSGVDFILNPIAADRVRRSLSEGARRCPAPPR